MICNSTNSVQISFIETLKLIVFSWTIWWCYWQNVLMINEKNNFLTVSWLSGLLSAEIFISTGEWGVQMPPLTSENSYFLRSGPQGATLVMLRSRRAHYDVAVMMSKNLNTKLQSQCAHACPVATVDNTIVSTPLQWRHNLRDGVKSPAFPLFAQLFVQAKIKEKIKAQRHWPLCGEFTSDRWISRTRGQ